VAARAGEDPQALFAGGGSAQSGNHPAITVRQRKTKGSCGDWASVAELHLAVESCTSDFLEIRTHRSLDLQFRHSSHSQSGQTPLLSNKFQNHRFLNRLLAPLHPEVDEVAIGSFRKLQPPEIRGSGYVVKSLEAALWAFHDAANFREAVLKAVNLGDDADTTGAVCGQLAGAYWGEFGIPQDWLERLARRDMIERALAGLVVPA